MKKLAFAAKALLLAVTIGLVSCDSGNEKAGDNASKDVKGEQLGEARPAQTNIRYVDMDSIYAHYEYAKEQNEILNQIALELQQYQNQLARQLQSKQSQIEQKASSNGYFTKESYEADVAELQKLDQTSSASYARRAQADEQRVVEIHQAVDKAIRDYIVKYNDAEGHKYDAILLKNAGVYFNPALDITGELVEGLNAEFKAKKDKSDSKDKEADKAEKK